jgi:hypothetical protein
MLKLHYAEERRGFEHLIFYFYAMHLRLISTANMMVCVISLRPSSV